MVINNEEQQSMMSTIDTQQQNKLSGDALELENQFITHCVDLASERVGGETLSCSDDFFAGMENLIKSGRSIFIDDKFTDRGKWMDGWESRRSYGRAHRRENGQDFDWCIIRLGIKGVIHGFDIDTNYFRGNAPESISIEACVSDVEPNDNTVWKSVLLQTSVEAHSQNIFRIDASTNTTSKNKAYTHVRLNMFPDGGIARIRVYGEAEVNWDKFIDGELIDLAGIKNGGKALLVSDMFFSDKNNLIMPGRGKNMGDGWETKRRRDPGPDWSIVKLASQGSIEKVIVDTCHFKGNYPDTFMLEGMVSNNDDFTNGNQEGKWQPIIARTKLYAHREHLFINELVVDNGQTFTHVRLNIFPDGGISRMRVFGKVLEKIQTKPGR